MNRKERRAEKARGRQAGGNPATAAEAEVQAGLATGIAHHQAGRVEQAEKAYGEVLARDGRNADALHLLGVLAHQSGRNEEAVDSIGRALTIDPDAAIYHCNMGVALRALGRAEEAAEYYRRATELVPSYAEAHVLLGNALDTIGRSAEAAESYRRSLELEPELVDAHTALGIVLVKLDDDAGAGRHFGRALELEPGSALAHKNMANILGREGNDDAAIEMLRRATQLDPTYAAAYSDLGSMLWDRYQPEEAEPYLRKAAELDPISFEARNSLGLVLQDLGRLEEAAEQFGAIVDRDPGEAEASSNLGIVLNALGRCDEAIAAYDAALSAKPDFHPARANRSLVRLARGEFEAGWEDYLARMSVRHRLAELSHEPVPAKLAGKRVRLVCDQGLGDEIFFLRFASELKRRGAWIAYEPDPKLASMVARLPFLDRLVEPGEDPGAIDFHYSVGDLPYLCAMRSAADIPPPFEIPALADKEGAARARLDGIGAAPYVGLTWRAGVALHNRLAKNAPLEALASALAPALVPAGATLVALQRLPEDGEIETLSGLVGRELHDFSRLNDDLESMLALIGLLDDYVCVSNTNTHLRAARGRRSRVLVPFPADYRWMNAGDESPWFPATPVYRQAVDGDWGGALGALAADLATAFPPGA